MDKITKERTFTPEITKLFHLLNIKGKYRVIGSSGLQSIKYGSDYDLSGIYTSHSDTLDSLYQQFLKKFKYFHNHPTIWITDFKCGLDSNGKPLRWTYENMIQNKNKLKNGLVVSLQDCLLVKAILKLDLIILLNGVFTEFTENYLITINNNSNFFNQDIKKETMLNAIKHDFDRYYYVANNYVKGLKRCFSYYKLEDAHKNKTKLLTLIDFFNSPVGLLYKINGDLDVILTVLQFKEKRPSHAVFIKNLSLCIDQLLDLYYTDIIPSIDIEHYKKEFNKITPQTEKRIEKLIEELTLIINQKTEMFIAKHPELLLY